MKWGENPGGYHEMQDRFFFLFLPVAEFTFISG
jgi:hypothetical protein